MTTVEAGAKRVLGVDPGYGRTGVGIVEERVGSRQLHLIHSSCIETSDQDPQPVRLATIQTQLARILDRHGPVDEASVELLTFGANVTTAMRVAEARGVALAEIGRRGIPCFHYTPMQIKSLTGSGAASKRELAFIVSHLLDVARIPGPDDAADGVAAAVWHLRGGRLAHGAATRRAGGHERMAPSLRQAVRLAREAAR